MEDVVLAIPRPDPSVTTAFAVVRSIVSKGDKSLEQGGATYMDTS